MRNINCGGNKGDDMEIVKSGHPALSSIAADVAQGEDLSVLVASMFNEMYGHKGIGLAANQVDVLKRVIVFHVGGMRQAIINPVITKRHPRTAISVEGCLSFPGKKVSMTRSKTVTVQGFDVDWKPVKISASGLTAFCIQHEIDHLNGKTISKNGGESSAKQTP